MKDTSSAFDKLEQVFASGPLYVDRGFLERTALKFFTELEIMASGGNVLEEVKARRHSAEPSLLFVDEDGALKTAKFTPEMIETRSGQIAHLKLNGTMIVDDFLSTRGVQSLAADIRAADQAPNISGILIEANTGGGELLAGQVLRNAIKDAKKPVLIYAHFLASAGVWGTLFADHIMAAGAGSEIGSIGVYTSISKEFLSRYRENVIDIYSRKSPNKNRDFRSLLSGDLSVLEANITEADEIFMADVRRNRPLSGDVEDTLAGGLFYATEARRRGLVDSIGTFSEAVSQLNRLIRNTKNSTMSKQTSFISMAKKFLGIEPETEEQALTALEEAPEAAAPAPSGLNLEEALEALTGKVNAFQATVEDLTGKIQALNEDLKKAGETALTQEQAQELFKGIAQADLSALKAEIAREINSLKTGKAGAEEATDEPMKLPKQKTDAPALDLLETVKAKQIKVVSGLS